jgi:hypothetical protein
MDLASVSFDWVRHPFRVRCPTLTVGYILLCVGGLLLYCDGLCDFELFDCVCEALECVSPSLPPLPETPPQTQIN